MIVNPLFFKSKHDFSFRINNCQQTKDGKIFQFYTGTVRKLQGKNICLNFFILALWYFWIISKQKWESLLQVPVVIMIIFLLGCEEQIPKPLWRDLISVWSCISCGYLRTERICQISEHFDWHIFSHGIEILMTLTRLSGCFSYFVGSAT